MRRAVALWRTGDKTGQKEKTASISDHTSNQTRSATKADNPNPDRDNRRGLTNYLYLQVSCVNAEKMLGFLRPSAAVSRHVISTPTRHHAVLSRRFHCTPLRAAVAHPITAHGPPPKAPSASSEFKQSDDADSVREEVSKARAAQSAALKKRFWKNVNITKKQGMFASMRDAICGDVGSNTLGTI